MGIRFILMVNKQGQTRLAQYYEYLTIDERRALEGEIVLSALPVTNNRFSWIHVDDLVNLLYEAMSNPSYKGVINGTAPNPVRLGEMCEQLGSVMGRPSWLPVPDLALKAVLGEGATVVLEGQKVLPTRAEELGFSFKYPYVKEALKDILS